MFTANCCATSWSAASCAAAKPLWHGWDWKLSGDEVEDRVLDFVENWLAADVDVYKICKDIMNASFFGYQPIEIIWQKGSQWLPSEIVAKPQEWFGFNDERELVFTENGLSQEPLPPYKFLCPRHEDDYLNPYGLGDLGLVFWLVTFKRGGMKFWVSSPKITAHLAHWQRATLQYP